MGRNVKLFSRIPNDFFYSNGTKLELIGGREGFVLYCLLTSRKNIKNEIYITYKQIVDTLKIDSNNNRAKLKIIEFIKSLSSHGYIKINNNIDSKNINHELHIEWIDLFEKSNKKGWIKFYADDFDLYSLLGVRKYSLIWVLRMYTNFETGTSYPSISDICVILKCSRNEIQDGIDLFRKTGLFKVKLGDYYYHEELDRKIRRNNEYKYIGDIKYTVDYINNIK